MGLLDKWINFYWPNGARCRSLSVAESRPVTMLDAQSAFIVLSSGIVLSITLLTTELLYRMYKRRNTVQPISIKVTERDAVGDNTGGDKGEADDKCPVVGNGKGIGTDIIPRTDIYYYPKGKLTNV